MAFNWTESIFWVWHKYPVHTAIRFNLQCNGITISRFSREKEKEILLHLEPQLHSIIVNTDTKHWLWSESTSSSPSRSSSRCCFVSQSSAFDQTYNAPSSSSSSFTAAAASALVGNFLFHTIHWSLGVFFVFISNGSDSLCCTTTALTENRLISGALNSRGY